MRSPSVSIGSVCVLFFVCHVGVQSIAADESDDGAICVSNRNRNRFLSLSLSLSFSLGIFFSADVIRKTSAIFNSVRRRCQADAGPGAYITAAIVIGCGQKCRFSFVFHIRFVFYFGIFTVARRGDDEKRWPPATTGGPVYRVFLPSFRRRRRRPLWDARESRRGRLCKCASFFFFEHFGISTRRSHRPTGTRGSGGNG